MVCFVWSLSKRLSWAHLEPFGKSRSFQKPFEPFPDWLKVDKRNENCSIAKITSDHFILPSKNINKRHDRMFPIPLYSQKEIAMRKRDLVTVLLRKDFG